MELPYRMKDYRERHESLIMEAAECELIAKLSTDRQKAENFRELAQQYRAMADNVRALMAGLQEKLKLMYY